MKTTHWIFVATLAAASAASHAQYVGPAPNKGAGVASAANGAPTTVRALLASGKDDTVVSLQGRIVRHLGGDKYRFADSSGEIDLEIDADKWPANTPIDDKVQVRVHGEFDKNLLTAPEIDVERIEKLK